MRGNSTRQTSSPSDAPARVTMKDIAAALGVSINTVHKAITGKGGVSEATRDRIVAYANEHGYRRNASASSLRRRDVHIVVCLPTPEAEGRYFYRFLWEGCQRMMDSARDSGARFTCVTFELGDYALHLTDILVGIERGERVDGLLALPPASAAEVDALRSLADAGVTIELVNGDNPQTLRFGAAVADYAAAGRLMAEQAHNLLRSHEGCPNILLISGDPYVDSHYLVARAFHEYMAEADADIAVEDFQATHGRSRELHDALLHRLGSEVPDLVCSVYAAGTEVLGDCLLALDLAGKIPAIGSDLFEESAAALSRGVFTNLVFKDPIGLAQRAMTALTSKLLWGTYPGETVETSMVDLIFRSNLNRYCTRMGIE